MDIDLELEIKISRGELRVFLLHEFRLGRKVTEATRNLCNTVGKNVLSIRTAQDWFSRFKNDNLELDGLPQIDRPVHSKKKGVVPNFSSFTLSYEFILGSVTNK